MAAKKPVKKTKGVSDDYDTPRAKKSEAAAFRSKELKSSPSAGTRSGTARYGADLFLLKPDKTAKKSGSDTRESRKAAMKKAAAATFAETKANKASSPSASTRRESSLYSGGLAGSKKKKK